MLKLYGVQWLRAVAAILVVAYHSALKWSLDFGAGAYGVDIFFVISGFIMWTITEGPIGPVEFLRDRLARIVPLYWIATVAMAAFTAAGLVPRAVLTPASFLTSIFFIPYSADGTHIWPLLVQGWTLNYEMIFYLALAGLILASRKYRLVGLIALFGAAVMGGVLVKISAKPFQFYTDPIVLEFVLGAIIGWAMTRRPVRHRLVGFGLVLAGALLFGLILVSPLRDVRILAAGAPAGLLVAGTVAIEQSGVSMKWRPLVFLGDASYSIYLFHYFIIRIAGKVLSVHMGVAAVASTVVAATAAACVIYLVIEKPLIGLLRRKRPLSDQTLVAASVLGTPGPGRD